MGRYSTTCVKNSGGDSALAKFASSSPGVVFDLTHRDTFNQMAASADDVIDVGFVRQPQRYLAGISLVARMSEANPGFSCARFAPGFAALTRAVAPLSHGGASHKTEHSG
jgi:hypothetical protein